MKKTVMKFASLAMFVFAITVMTAQNNEQSDLTRILQEEQKVSAQSSANQAALLSDLQKQKQAIIDRLDRQAKQIYPNGITISPTLSSSSTAIHVGSVSNARYGAFGWTLNGAAMTTSLAKLSNTSNFGTGGTYSRELAISHETSTINAAMLANYDVFFIGWWQDGTFSSTELDALYNWVQSGGNLIITADDASHDAVAQRFGYANAGPGSTVHNVVLTSHPIFSGPFGNITTFNASGNRGAFNQGSATLLANNSFGTPSVLETTVGSGLVLLFADVDMMSTWGGRLSGGSGISTNNDILLANTFAYMADNAFSDADGDGIADNVDNCPNTANPNQVDSDGDGLGDACDACPLDPDNDIDGDGVCGDVDNCPNTANPNQVDSDGDGLGDVCDACPLDPDNDIDGDGICGDVDNCVNDANTDQADDDCDGVGNVCDICPGGDDSIDADGDGNPDCAVFPGINNVDPSWVCGNKGNKVLVAHFPPGNSGNVQQLCLSPNAVQAHLNHGCYVGPYASCSNKNGLAIDMDEDWTVELFPNPADQVVNIHIIHLEAEATLEVININGAVVYSETFNGSNVETTIDLMSANMNNGVYIVRVASGDKIENIRLIVSK